ncbi:MAG TPA: ParB N-terminal domain-containing protein [Anaerolineales bacterium]|nr:ParB N-terminal domain-containing protein [Anaerolineales bacterium]
MNIYPSFTNVRSFMSYRFSTLRMNALRDSLWAKLTGRNTKLAIFPEKDPQRSPNRRCIGIRDIELEQIIGTLGRQSDFDHKFRPLKSHLRERWVNIHLTQESVGWSPIVVHKVGDRYYVEDGHHRVSVARSLGMAFIQAKVWEYPVSVKQTKKCQLERCAERSSVRAYAQ